jgi:TonB-linked SusC/RagA family outer membrane protein
MKKNCLHGVSRARGRLRKILMFMKLLSFLLLVGALQMSATGYSQKSKVSLKVQNKALVEVLDLIRMNTGYTFVYSTEVLDESAKVSIDKQDAQIVDVLDELFKDKQLKFRIVDDVVIISPALVKETIQEKRQVKGVVKDDTGMTLIGVNVVVKDANVGTVSDVNGQFVLDVPEGYNTLIFSYIGFKKLEYPISGDDDLNIVLQPEISEISETVVTGYFNKGKTGFAGSVSTFKQEDIQKVSTGNVLTTLSVLDAGFRIHENNLQGSNPNAVPDFTIRGRGSFQNESTQPIFIVDGFQSNAEFVMDMAPNRIKSMSILKDAAATILYGSRAANGVVVIETVSPQPGELRVTYDFRPTIAIPDLTDYNLMNASEKLEFEKLAGLYIGSDPEDQFKKDMEYNEKYKAIQEGVDTYWLAKPVENVLSQAHSLYVEGGADQVRYGVDAAYSNVKGVMKGSGNDKFDLGFKLVYRIANKITVQNYASFSYRNKYNSPYGNFKEYTLANPYERIYDKDGNMNPKLSDGQINPLFDTQLPFEDENVIQSIIERFNLDWTINDAFRFKANFQVNYGDISGKQYRSPFSSEFTKRQDMGEDGYGYLPVEKRGRMEHSDGKSIDLSSNVVLNYNKSIGVHTLFFGLGGELMYSDMNAHGFKVEGFPNDQYPDVAFAMNYVENSKPNSVTQKEKSVGAFLNGNYIFNDKYFADLSIRYDGSSKFGTENKFAPFWSVGGGWNIHKEEFFYSSFLDELKLRYNYGITGNQEFSAYQALTMYQYQTNLLYFNTISATLQGYGNPDLKWQEQKSHNLGLDFSTGKGRLRGGLDYYKKRTSGMLADITVAPSLGFPDGTYKANLGEIENVGYEANFNAILLRNHEKKMEWGMGLQIAHNKSKILEISEALKTINDKNNEELKVPGLVFEEGQSLSAIKAVKSLGIDPATGEELFLKKDGKTVTSVWDADDKIYSGDTEPDLFGNISNNFSYKGWNLNAVFYYSLGADRYNQTVVDKVENLDPTKNGDVRALNDRWKQPGDITAYKGIDEKYNTYISTRFVQTENLLQLRSLTLSYQFNKEWLKKYRIETMRLSFYANDVFRLSNIEVERGTEYPFARSFGMGLNVRF